MIRRSIVPLILAAVSLSAVAACGTEDASARQRAGDVASNVASVSSVSREPITKLADVALPIHAAVSATDIEPRLEHGVCTAAPVQARAIDANGRTVDPRLVEWASTDTTVLTVDRLGVVRVVSCDFTNKTAGIVATVRRIDLTPAAPGDEARAARARRASGVRS
jgi:hypothetical protein